MSKPVELLHNEHVQLARLLDLLQGCLQKELDGNQGRKALELMDCLVRYPNQFHHPVEDLLFERMHRHDPTLGRLLKELDGDHRRLSQHGDQLLDLLELGLDGDSAALATIRRVGMAYIGLFRTHMEVEETDLFPLADGLLNADDWRCVEAGIERCRAEGLDAQAARCYQKLSRTGSD